MYNINKRQVKGIAVWIITFYSIYGLNSRSCVGGVELYQFSKHPNEYGNREQCPELGGESSDFMLQLNS